MPPGSFKKSPAARKTGCLFGGITNMKRIWRKITGVFAAFLTVFCIVSPVFAFAPSSPAQFDGIDVSKWQGTID